MRLTSWITLTLVILMAVSALATDTRVLTMGDNNNILLDEANIWMYPSRIGYYPDLAGIELADHDEINGYGDSSPLERVGVNFKFGDKKPFVLGLYLHNGNRFANYFSPIAGNMHGEFLGDGDSYSNRRADLFYGRKLGDNDFGLHFGVVHSSEEGIAVDDYDEHSFSQFNIDLGLTMKDGLFDLAVGMESFTFTDKDTRNRNQGQTGGPDYFGADSLEAKGNRSFYARARCFHELNRRSTVIPHASFATGSFEYNEWDWIHNAADSSWGNSLDSRNDYDVTDFDLGVGLNYSPSSNMLTALDFGFRSNKISYRQERPDVAADTTIVNETADKYVALPYFKLGFEADVFKWMAVRFGATSYWTKYTDENVTAEEKQIERYPSNETYLGLGFNWGNLHVDSYVDPELFLNGFDFISGGGRGRMNMMISAVYEMH